MISMFDFSNMTVIVTGSGAGMGREAAKLFAAYGANVVVNARSASCEEAREEIAAGGGSVISVQSSKRPLLILPLLTSQVCHITK